MSDTFREQSNQLSRPRSTEDFRHEQFNSFSTKIFGLVELDEVETVLYSRLESAGRLDGSAIDVAAHNFYTEVAPFMNVEEFHQRLDTFNGSSEPANNFVFSCNLSNESF